LEHEVPEATADPLINRLKGREVTANNSLLPGQVDFPDLALGGVIAKFPIVHAKKRIDFVLG
jgi:hypothetical protein